MKDCCFQNIDKAQRMGRASYRCVECKADVSLLWFFYQDVVHGDSSHLERIQSVAEGIAPPTQKSPSEAGD